MSTTPGQQAWTLGRLLDWTAKHFAEKGCEFPRLDAEVLLAHVAACRRIDLYTRFEELASEDIRTRYKHLIGKRIEGCPVAYLVGRKEFYSLEFEVTRAVLIPRPDTETLIVACLEIAKRLAAPRILDIGTGSGCISVTLAKHIPSAKVTAVDISPDALEVARRNAAKHKVAERVRFQVSDLIAAVDPAECFDLVVSNPPYIASEDLPNLPVGVRQYEPKIALDGGLGGYGVIERLLSDAAKHLPPGGWLVIEIGSPQEESVRKLMSNHPELIVAPTIRDHGGLPRVLKAQRQ